MRRALTAILLAAGLAAPAARAGGAVVCVEAESAATNEPQMVVVRDDAPPPGVKAVEGASARAYLEIPQGAGNPPSNSAGRAVLALDLPEEGDYTVWLRVWWDDSCGNSFTVQVDGRPAFVMGEDGTYRAWHWVRHPVSRMAAPLRLAAGAHTLTILNREDGARVDQVLLSAEKRFVPVDAEKTGVRP